MQEADRHRLHRASRQRVDRRVQRGRVQRQRNGAVRPHPLGDPEPQAARHQRLGRGHAQIVALGLQALAHFDDVAMAGGRQHANPRGLAFQQRIGGNGGAMHDAQTAAEQRRGRQAKFFRGQRDAVEHPVRLVPRGGGGFGGDHPAIGAGDDDIGEGAANIDPDREAHWGFLADNGQMDGS